MDDSEVVAVDRAAGGSSSEELTVADIKERPAASRPSKAAVKLTSTVSSPAGVTR
jgi:hypothetical protein